MKFDYVKPSTKDELNKYLVEGGVIFSGGTDVFVKIRAGALKPKILIDSKGVVSNNISILQNSLILYINNTYTELLESEEIKNQYPILNQIVSSIGSTQIRNKGTMIGNIANASPAGDFLLACYLYDSEVKVEPTNRMVPISEFIKGPGKIDLNNGEFIYSVELPKLDGYKFYYEKVGRRNEMVISIASIGIAVKLDNNKVIKDIRIAYGSVGPTVVRIRELEKEFINKEFTYTLFESMSDKYFERINPIDDVRGSANYRKKVVKNLLIKSYYELAGEYK